MKLKKFIWINTFSIFVISFLAHFLYEWFPNSLFALFFPVNESVWEHMKMLYSCIMFYGIMEYFIYKKLRYPVNNFLLSLFLRGYLSIPIYLIIYLPLDKIFGHHMIIAISVLFISILLSEIISYFVKQKENSSILNLLSIFLIIIGFIIFGYLTYHPIKTNLFYDEHHHKYGINIYTK